MACARLRAVRRTLHCAALAQRESLVVLAAGIAFGQNEGKASIDQSPGELGASRAFDDGHDLSVDPDSVVAHGQCSALGSGLLMRESYGQRWRVSISTTMSAWPEARRVGTRIPGRALAVVRGDCQKIASRPSRSRVNSTTSASSGQPSAP